nr:hypothetical protein [Tanacetum cinerariifolium]
MVIENKNVQAYNAIANKPPIPPQDPITPPTILTPSLVLPPSPLFVPQHFFVPEELLPPKKQIHPISSSSTKLSNSFRKQAYRLTKSAHFLPIRKDYSVSRGYKYHPLHVISYPLDQIRTDLSYVEEPEAILDRQDRVMRKKTIPFVKILWRNHPEWEATWETEESIWTSYPHFLP